MDEQEQLKYTYRFSLKAEKTGESSDEPGKGEVQSYINDLLGLDDKKSDKNRLPS